MKVAIITGASSGIGLAAALRFAAAGYAVYGTGRRPYENTAFRYLQADVNDTGRMKEIFEEVAREQGRIDVLVNNAGFGIAGAIEDASAEHIGAIVSTDLTAVATLCMLAIPYLKKTRGRIVNLSSVGGIIPLPYQAMYSAAKSAVDTFSRALATELRPFGVGVTSILPGDTKTGFTEARVFDENEESGNRARMRRSVDKMARDEQSGVSPDKVACAILRAAECRRPPLRVTVGLSYKLLVFLTRLLPLRAINAIVRILYS